MEILTKFQKEFLKNLGKTELSKYFYFGGGIALSHYYLKHRYSEDLDFFTTDETKIRLISLEIKKIEEKIDAKLEIRRTSETFVEAFLIKGEEKILIHFALEAPFRFEPLKFDSELNIYYENLLDLSCNKFSALFERHETKAKKKHVGMEEYWLLLSLDHVRSIEKLPRMVKPVTIKELQEFYEDKIIKLMKKIKKGEI